MLKGIHPLLTADLLHVLAAMGHGDEIAIVDANFPSARVGRRVIQLAGASSPEVLAAVLTVFPLDTDAIPAAFTMAVIGDPDALPEAVADFAGVRISAAPHPSIFKNASADAGGKRHVEQRSAAAAGAVQALPQGADVRIVIHHRGSAGYVPHEAAQVEIAPASHMGGEHHTLRVEVHRSAEADPAAFELQVRSPVPDDLRELRSHPLAAALRQRGPRLPPHHALPFEGCDGELRTANIDSQDHATQHFSRGRYP